LLAFPSYAEHVLLKHKFDEDFKKMRVVEVDKKGMPTTSLRGRVVEVDKKGISSYCNGTT
jgi:hypothetical protein